MVLGEIKPYDSEIIALELIALKLFRADHGEEVCVSEIIALELIALKLFEINKGVGIVTARS